MIVLADELPDFTSITPAGLAARIREQLTVCARELERIASQTEHATVENTLLPFELGYSELTASMRLLWTYTGSVGGSQWDVVEAELSAPLAEYADARYQDPRLFQRFEALAGSETDEQTARTISEHLKRFRASGAHLPEAPRQRLREINARLAVLETEFNQRVVRGSLVGAVPLSEADVSGLSANQRAGLAADAAQHPELADGQPFLAVLRAPTQQPLLTSLDSAAARARLLEAAMARGDGHDPHSDTRHIVLEMARLRAEKAEILGYTDYAAYIAALSTAGSSQAIDAFLTSLVEPARRNVEAEREALAAEYRADEAGPEASQRESGSFTAADWAYQRARSRREKTAIDEADLSPYFELWNVVENGVFFAANRLYGLEFVPRPELRGYAPDMRVWEVRDADGEVLGLFLGDYYARAGKAGGAWMHSLQDRSHRGHQRAIICNNLNITRPPEGEPTLLTWDEVTTSFHEFGHALHGFLSDVEWPSTAGTAVPRDFVEYPSQLNEVWAAHPQVLASYARHIETGAALPAEFAEYLRSGRGGDDGFAISEMLQAVLLDQAWHRLHIDDVPVDEAAVADFERQALQAAGVGTALIPPRYRSTYYKHVFGSDYSAGYYSYLWSEALDADTVDWLRTEGADGDDGGLNRRAGERLRTCVLSRGNSRDPMEGFRQLRGRDVDTQALLRRRNLAR